MRHRSLVLLYALALSACGNKCCCIPPPPSPASSPDAGASASVAPHPYRVVGLAGRCDDVEVLDKGTWKGKPVFQSKDPKLKLPDSMRRLCAFDWLPHSKNPGATPDYAAIDDPKNPREPDHQVVVTLDNGQALVSKVREDRRIAYFNEVGGLKPLPANPLGKVWIGFPDSSPSGENNEIRLGTDPHGFNVAWVARYLTCPNGPDSPPCISKIHMEPALDHRAPPMVADPKSQEGVTGSFGTRTALAGAIFNTVETWRKTVAEQKSNDHLVINLSVGWEPEIECVGKGLADKILIEQSPVSDQVPPSQIPSKLTSKVQVSPRDDRARFLPPQIPSKLAPKVQEPAEAWLRRIAGCVDGSGSGPKQSVLAAITYAACHGALVLAAAGNDTGYHPPFKRPVYPAAWENVPMPSQAICEELFTDSVPTPNTEGTYRPLLYAIGGVFPGDAPIPTTRVEGMPRLVAPASLAVAYPDTSGQDGYPENCKSRPGCSQPLTGTSMATAVASGTAAAVWAYRPELSPYQVMDILYRTGQVLPYTETFYREWHHTSFRISFCNAINDAIKEACPKCQASSCDMRAPLHPNAIADPNAIATDGFRAEVVDQPPPNLLLGAVSGQPRMAGCPDCVVEVNEEARTWVVKQGSVYNSYFTDTTIGKLGKPELKLYSSTGHPILTADLHLYRPGTKIPTNLEDMVGPLLSNAQGATFSNPKDPAADVSGTGSTGDKQVAHAFIFWTQVLTDNVTTTVGSHEVPITR